MTYQKRDTPNAEILFTWGEIPCEKEKNRFFRSTVNHLGNVLEVVTDRKLQIETTIGSGVLDYYSADVVSQYDYFPFGMLQANTNIDPSTGLTIIEENDYRYAFNGMEKDDEVSGEANSYDFGARFYNPRVGRFFVVDPNAILYAFMSPYCYAGNSPMRYADENGEGPGDRVTKAKELQKKYKDKGVTYSQEKRQVGVDVLYADCSTFVTTILNESGYGGMFKTNYTGSGNGGGIQGEIQKMSGASDLKEPYSLTPQEGDIVMWGGHIAIVTQVTADEVQFAAMGNSGAHIGKIPLTNGVVDLSNAATLKATKTYGSGGFWGFWSPETAGVSGSSGIENNDNLDLDAYKKEMDALGLIIDEAILQIENNLKEINEMIIIHEDGNKYLQYVNPETEAAVQELNANSTDGRTYKAAVTQILIPLLNDEILPIFK